MRQPHPPFKIVVGVAAETLREAGQGNYRLLAVKLRGDFELRRDERSFLADLLDRRWEPPPSAGRRPNDSKKRHVAKFVYVYETLHPIKRDAIVALAMQRYGVARSYVFAALREFSLKTLLEPDGSLYVEFLSPADPLVIGASLQAEANPAKRRDGS